MPPAAKTYIVYCLTGGFSPKVLANVPTGACVHWHNCDASDFQMVTDTGWIIGHVLACDSIETTFTEAGTYHYYDAYDLSLTGTIIVVQ